MSTTNRRNRMPTVAPERGSFPLDHFHECEEQAYLYHECLDKHQMMPKRCQKFQINYIECRMKHGLMGAKMKGDKPFENFGFTEANTYESEREKKRAMFKQLVEIDKMAERNIYRMKGYQDVDNNMYKV